jgi:hypothetical protein
VYSTETSADIPRLALFWAIVQRVAALPYRRCWTTYRPHAVPSWPLKMGPIGCTEMSLRNYHYSLRKSPEERSSHLLHGGSLKWRIPRLCTQTRIRVECTSVWTSFNSTCICGDGAGLKKEGVRVLTGSFGSYYGPVVRSCEHGNEYLSSITGATGWATVSISERNFFHGLSYYSFRALLVQVQTLSAPIMHYSIYCVFYY